MLRRHMKVQRRIRGACTCYQSSTCLTCSFRPMRTRMHVVVRERVERAHRPFYFFVAAPPQECAPRLSALVPMLPFPGGDLWVRSRMDYTHARAYVCVVEVRVRRRDRSRIPRRADPFPVPRLKTPRRRCPNPGKPLIPPSVPSMPRDLPCYLNSCSKRGKKANARKKK